jgi:hypothetical protein
MVMAVRVAMIVIMVVVIVMLVRLRHAIEMALFTPICNRRGAAAVIALHLA